MNFLFSQDVTARIDAYLDSVEDRLRAAGVARHRRGAVIDDLETQIVDSLSELDRPVSVTDADVVLARLDPPEAYLGPDDLPEPSPSPAGLNRAASVGRWALGSGVAATAFFFAVAIPQAAQMRSEVALDPLTHRTIRTLGTSDGWTAVALASLVAALLALLIASIAGWTAAWQIGGQVRRPRGLAWAALEALSLPLAAAWFAAFGLAYMIGVAYEGIGNRGASTILMSGQVRPHIPMSLSDTGRAATVLIGVAIGTVFTCALVFLFCRVARINWRAEAAASPSNALSAT